MVIRKMCLSIDASREYYSKQSNDSSIYNCDISDSNFYSLYS